jgi:hypothetical protein
MLVTECRYGDCNTKVKGRHVVQLEGCHCEKVTEENGAYL